MNALVVTQMSMVQLETQRRSAVSSHVKVSLVLMPRKPKRIGPSELAVRNLAVSKHVKAILVQMATWPARMQVKLEEITPLVVRSVPHGIVKLAMPMDPSARRVWKGFI